MRNQISLLAIDLGANLGWSKCICTLRPEPQIVVADHGTIYLDALATERMRKDYNEVFTRRRVRLTIAEEQIRKLVELAKFDCFITEDVFCNPKIVAAFRAMVLYMDVLERVVNVEKQKRLYTIPPTQVKSHISGYGMSDKSQVQNAVLSNPNISMKRPSDATEHEFDSVAVAWAFIHEYLVTLV